MALDIQSITNAVNSYLNSISEVGQNVQEAMDASERKRQFTDTLGEAIKAETQKRLVDFPDIPSMIQKNMENHMRVDTTFPTAQENAAAGAAATKASEGASSAGAGNSDAYKGQLSAEALQELAKSGYFSGNLVQSNLFQESSGENTSSSTSSAFDTSSLSDLNTKYLLASYLNKNTDTAKSVFGDFQL